MSSKVTSATVQRRLASLTSSLTFVSIFVSLLYSTRSKFARETLATSREKGAIYTRQSGLMRERGHGGNSGTYRDRREIVPWKIRKTREKKNAESGKQYSGWSLSTTESSKDSPEERAERRGNGGKVWKSESSRRWDDGGNNKQAEVNTRRWYRARIPWNGYFTR